MEAGNNLLHNAINLANEENMQKLETVWQGQALATAQAFAAEIYEQYAKPLNVEFEYLTLPIIESRLPQNRLVVTSQERWTYGGPTKIDHQESFKFIYTVTRQNGQWVIIQYSYLNLPQPTPTLSRTRLATPTGSVTSAP